MLLLLLLLLLQGAKVAAVWLQCGYYSVATGVKARPPTESGVKARPSTSVLTVNRTEGKTCRTYYVKAGHLI